MKNSDEITGDRNQESSGDNQNGVTASKKVNSVKMASAAGKRQAGERGVMEEE